MTEADATETEKPDVPFPVATTWQNIKTELREIKKNKVSGWAVTCVAFAAIRSHVLIFGTGQSGEGTEITTWTIRISESKTANISSHWIPSSYFQLKKLPMRQSWAKICSKIDFLMNLSRQSLQIAAGKGKKITSIFYWIFKTYSAIPLSMSEELLHVGCGSLAVLFGLSLVN